jgi:hypothetical protein
MMAAEEHSSEDPVRSYADACRARIPEFTECHFGWRGSLRLHRSAFGWDLLRAPLNVLLVGPALFLRLVGLACRGLGQKRVAHWLGTRNLFIETQVARRMADLMLRDLLQLDGSSAVLPAGTLDRIHQLIAEYLAARHAVAEFATGFATIAAGVALVQALTPSAITLGPLLARELAESAAVESFWLGPWAGAIWHDWFPAHATWPETIGTTIAVMACFALVATFMGMLTDPLLQLLGLHRRRLTHLVNTLHRIARGDRTASLGLPDLYIARLTDIADVILLAIRMTR